MVGPAFGWLGADPGVFGGMILDLDTGGGFGILQAGVLLFIFGKEQADSQRD